jgi:hypothetical protein
MCAPQVETKMAMPIKDQGYSILHLAHGELKVITDAELNCVMWFTFKIYVTKTKQKFCPGVQVCTSQSHKNKF